MTLLASPAGAIVAVSVAAALASASFVSIRTLSTLGVNGRTFSILTDVQPADTTTRQSSDHRNTLRLKAIVAHLGYGWYTVRALPLRVGRGPRSRSRVDSFRASPQEGSGK